MAAAAIAPDRSDADSHDLPDNGLPSLFAVRSPGGVRVFWTLGFPNWELVSSTNLFPPVWTPVPATNCDNQVVLPVTTREQYFRLRRTN
jgi:hypothetical protein